MKYKMEEQIVADPVCSSESNVFQIIFLGYVLCTSFL